MTAQVAKSLLGEPLPEDKLKETFNVQKGTEMDTPKAAIACLKYLLTSAVCFNADSSTFSEELQQLGLPKEHATAICKVFDEFGAKIKDDLISKSLTVNEFKNASVVTHPEKTIDCIQLQVKLKNEIVEGKLQPETCHSVNVKKSDIPILLNELKTIKTMMDETDFK